MWRKNTFAENQESDQSISEDEGLGPDWPEDGISLDGGVDKKEGIHIQSQLEILRDTCDQRQKGFSIEDDVEISVFHNERDFTFSPRRPPTRKADEEIISDEEKNNVPSTLLITSGAKDLHKASPHSFQSEMGDMACTWSVINKEAEALVLLNENARCSSSHAASSKLHKSCQGGRGKAKPKLSFRFQSRKEDPSYSVNRNDGYDISYNVVSLPEELDTADHRGMEDSMAELLEDSEYDIEKLEQLQSLAIPAEVAVGHNYTEHSMAELLDAYQEKNAMLRVNYGMSSRTKGRRSQLVVKKSISTWGDKDVDDNDLPEALESGSSSDDELFKLPKANVQNLKVILPESKGKTMVDQFQEAFGVACMNGEDHLFALPRQSRATIFCSSGLFGKLQQVMQSEKEREMDFLQSLQTGTISNVEASCIDVKILSRCLEAKLTVCRCFLSRGKESYFLAESCPIGIENEERTLTVIFSSRVCSDVEFEVGDLICIHSPWKEIRVPGRDEIIILSTCFSQILTS